MSYSAEEMAKILFPKGLPGTNGWEDAKALLTPEQLELIRKEAERMEANLNSMTAGNVELCEVRNELVQEPGNGKIIEQIDHVLKIDDETPMKGDKKFVPYSPAQPHRDHMLNFLVEGVAPVGRQSAHGFLDEASETMKKRAALRDSEEGERTAAQIAKVFNAITGHELSEADAWTFLICLKIVRSRNGKFNRDDYVDLSAYSALLGESESVNRKA